MFALRPIDLAGRRVLDCAGGPASFNAELTARGGRVISADPLYAFSADEIRSRIDDARSRIVESTRSNLAAYRWDTIHSIEALERLRLSAMNRFLQDYPAGVEAGRYRAETLPNLSFADQTFDLLLCSHYLFTYSNALDLDDHVNAVLEMARVGREVRIFPLLDLNGEASPHLMPLMTLLSRRGLVCKVVPVPYEFQRGGNELLRISRAV